MRAADVDGSSWPTRKIVSHYSVNSPEDWEGTRLDTVMAFLLIDGAPAIIGGGYVGDEGSYVFVQANNAAGSSWPAEYNPIGKLLNGSISLGAINDRLAFLRRENDDDILYNLALDPQLGTWAESELVDQLEVAGEHFWLLDTDGIPAAIYYEDLLSSLKYRRALNADGSAWGEPVVLSTTAGSHSRAAVVDGRPTVIYNDRIEDEVKMVAANNSEGTLWGMPSSVPEYPWNDPWPQVELTPFAGIAGQPAFIYTARHALEGDDHETELHYVSYY
jgi:hypothetical protein